MNNYYVKNEWGWNHRHPLKLIINPILRNIQFFTNRPYVMASVTEFIDGVPHFIKFGFYRVAYTDNVCKGCA
jgi:hypothetical protein